MGAKCTKIDESTSLAECRDKVAECRDKVTECRTRLSSMGFDEIDRLRKELTNAKQELNNMRELSYDERVSFIKGLVSRYNEIYEYARNNIAINQCVNLSSIDIKQLNDLWLKFYASNYTDTDLDKAIQVKLSNLLTKAEEFITVNENSPFPFQPMSVKEEVDKLRRDSYRVYPRERFLFGLFGKSIFNSIVNVLILILLIVLIVFVVKKTNKQTY